MFDNLRMGNIHYSADPDAVGGAKPEAKATVKTFTQEEVNTIIGDRLNKEKAKFEAEIAKVNSKVKNLGFENFDEVAKLKNERDEYAAKVGTLTATLTKNERINKLKSLGVDDEFIDFVLFKVEDEEKYEEFIKTNPRIIAESFKTQASNPRYTGGTSKKLDEAESPEDYIRLRRESKK